MVCDMLGSGMTYQGKKWTNKYELDYWMRNREKAKINPKLDFLLTKVFMDISEKGYKEVLKSKYLHKIYIEYTR